MEIKELLEELDRLNLPKDKVAITSSGPMGIRGIREIGDLDIIVYPEVWKDLTKRYAVDKEHGIESINIGNIQVLGKGSFFTDPEYGNLKRDIDDADIIDGYRYVKLEKILKIKKMKSRDKDKRDVGLIEDYLNSDPSESAF